MQARFVHIILLFAMMLNITHASIIASEDRCIHESVQEYVMEQSQSTECSDLCDLHHLFHMAAIITPVMAFFGTHSRREQPDSILLSYHPPFQSTENKPPIA